MSETRELQQRNIDALTTIERWTPEQVALVMRTVAKGATHDELRLFAAVCGRTGLDPFTKQIHLVKRWDSAQKAEVMAIQVGIDGFRVIAARTKQYAGRLGPYWCGPDGVWHEVWLREEPPFAAKVGIRRKGFTEPLWQVARWSALVQTKKTGEVTRFWSIMGPEQLAKCAEAAGMRAAFPNDLGGLYAPEEIHDEEESPVDRAAEAAMQTLIKPEVREITIEEVEFGVPSDDDFMDAQMRTPEFLLDLAKSLEKKWKAPGSIVSGDPGKEWFINHGLLVRAGRKNGDGSAAPGALFNHAIEDMRLTSDEVLKLSQLVTDAIDTHNNNGKPTKSVHPNEVR